LAKTHRVSRDVLAVEEDGSCRRFEQAGEHLRGRALPRSIGSEIANHLASTYFKADVVDDCDAVEPLHQVSRFEHARLLDL